MSQEEDHNVSQSRETQTHLEEEVEEQEEEEDEATGVVSAEEGESMTGRCSQKWH